MLMAVSDIHTHHVTPLTAAHSVLNVDCCQPSAPFAVQVSPVYCSVGLHPCFLVAEELPHQWESFVRRASCPDVVAVGECGLDKRSPVPMPVQMQVLSQLIQFAKAADLSIIIHCVKAMDQLLQCKRLYGPSCRYAWHGFRGKPQQALQLVSQGFYLSYGHRFNPDSLLVTPPDRLLLETDEADTTLPSVATAVAHVLGTDEVAVMRMATDNAQRFLRFTSF